MSKKQAERKRKSWKKEVVEWIVILGIGLSVYLLGWHTEIIGRMQQVILWTGIMQPETELTDTERMSVDYNMPLVTLEGNPVHLSAFKGDVIFLNFWATWCPPCIAEMPNIQALYEQYKQKADIEFVMVSLDEDPAKAEAFMKRKGFTLPVYKMAGNRPHMLRSSVVPTTYVISKDGYLVSKKEGMANYNTSSFKQFLETLLNE